MFFFFFKQKTAYEMRISDWSSDVCSSDLQEEKSALKIRPEEVQKKAPAKTQISEQNKGPQKSVELQRAKTAVTSAVPAIPHPPAEQIGRASRRERVCQ